MSACKKNRILISRMIDNDLSFEERCNLEKHLQSCDQCFTVFKGYKKISTVIDTVFTENHAAIKTYARPSEETLLWKFFKMNGLIPITGFATLAILLTTLFFLNNFQSKKSPLLSEQSTVSLMSLPLSSFSCYGIAIEDTVKSRFSYSTEANYTEEYPDEIYSGYESPLFNDRISDNSHFYHSSQYFLE